MESLPLLAVLVVASMVLSSAVGFHIMMADLLLLHRENSPTGGTSPQYLLTPEAKKLKHPALSNCERW